MALISLLLALLLERVIHLNARLQLDDILQRYLYPYLPFFHNKGVVATLTVLLIPCVLVYAGLDLLNGLYYALPAVLAGLALLLISFGGSQYRKDYRKYLKALCRNDLKAKGMYATCLDVNSEHYCEDTLTQAVAKQLVWINYRFYFAVIFYFVLLGPVGLTFYVAARSYHRYITQQQAATVRRSGIHILMRIIDWVPARLTMLGYALVAEEQTALPESLRAWRDLKTPEFECLGRVVFLASRKNVETAKCYDYTCYLVQLAKRNIILFITIISLLTIHGSVV